MKVDLTTVVKNICVWHEFKKRPTQSIRYLYYSVKQKWNLINQKQICFAVTSYGTLSTHDKKLDQWTGSWPSMI